MFFEGWLTSCGELVKVELGWCWVVALSMIENWRKMCV